MELLGDPLLSESFTKLTEIVIHVAKTTADFKPELDQLQNTLQLIAPIIDDVVKLNQILDRSEQQSAMFVDRIQDAEKLVQKCSKIKRNFIKKYTHSLKLKDANNKLLRFFQLEVQADQLRDIRQTLVEVDGVISRIDSLSVDARQIHQTWSYNSLSVSSRYELIERGNLGWRVPLLPRGIVAFDEPLKKLKAKVFEDSDAYDDGSNGDSNSMEIDDDGDESSVVVVAAAGGCGKTTLVTMLCHDSDIKGKFRENIFFVTVSETPNFMVIVNELFNPNSSSQPIPFQSDEDAKNKLGNFLLDKVSRPMLLVLDDVWDHSFIDNFPLKIKGCKILVTSRSAFPRFDVFRFDPLSDEDAKILFCQSAFTESKKRPRIIIDENLVNQMVKCCKKHPLTLAVVGGSLNGRDESAWRSMLRTLSHGSSVLYLNEQARHRLERSFTALDEEFKECYLDFGLFPEDQRIPASSLLDMWVHLYNHDDAGVDTFDKIVGLSFRNLVNLVATRKDSAVTVNYCDQQFVTQHNLLRELAIHLSSKPGLPIAQRKRLIITTHGEDLPASVLNIQEPMQARILSISSEELFSSRWCEMKVPEVEVMVLNLKSKTYTLPYFMTEMQKLKVLNVTNYGLYPSYIDNFLLIGSLSNLSRIRLERVEIPSLDTSILALENLQKASFMMCKIGNAFATKLSNDNLKVWPKLVELEIDYCHDLVGFPDLLCSSVHLKNLSITNCNELCEISEEFGILTNLENFSLRSCTKLEKLPESITRLQKLSILDISDCLSLSGLPDEFGKLGGLRTLYMMGCTGICELPLSVEELAHTHVVCNEEMYDQWLEFGNVKVERVEEDRVETLMKIIRFDKHNSQDIKQTLAEVSDMESRMNSLLVDARQIHQTWSSNSLSVIERGELGWRAPILPRGIVAFDEPLKKLKAKVFEDLKAYDDGSNGDSNSMEIDDDGGGGDESSVVVVAAAGGCGKTTLVTMLCHDSDIKGKFRENIFFVTVSETPNFMVIVSDLLNPNPASQPIQFQGNEDAKKKLGAFLYEKVSRPMLLVLDDVWNASFIDNFQFNIKGCKILVTSRNAFLNHDVFRFDPLSDEDAKIIFCQSAFGARKKRSIPTVDGDIVNQMVKCCKKHPLTLSVVGSSLKGKPEFVWKSVMRTLTQAEWVLDNKDSQRRMKLTIKLTIEQLGDEFKKCLRDFEALDEEFKQCLLDLGLFPRNQRISACALLDIWMSLYDHDDMGRDTLIKIFQLADRKFVSSITIGEEANAVVNYCEQTFTTLHDWQRELAIHFSSDEPISQRTRLIIDAQGDDLPAPITQTKEIIRARILSISTGESFSSRWCNMNAPEVEVMVLNIMSETYTLPRFLENMNRLKVLNVTNYGLHTTKFVNFHLFGSLISLTRIRLECVVVSLLSESLLALVNLQKLSFIMCKTDNSFEKRSTYNPNIWPRLVEIEIDSCQDLVVFPELFCNSVHLEKLSINNCNEMIQIPEEFGKLTSLETLSLRSCAKLGKLPCSISRLKKLSVLDMSDCKSLNELPENIGELSGLQMIYMKGCTGIRELPLSVKDLSQLQVFCDEEISYKWLEFLNVKIPVVEEDRLFTLTEKIFNACF